MTDFERQMEDLGNAIESIIDEAVNSRDFQKLSSTIRGAVQDAVNAGGRAVNRAADRIYPKYTVEGTGKSSTGKKSQPNRNVYSKKFHYANVPESEQPANQVPSIYVKPSVAAAGGTGRIISGGALMGVGGGLYMGSAMSWFVRAILGFHPGVLFPVIPLAMLGTGTWLLVSGLSRKGLGKRFARYVSIIGTRTVTEIKTLARTVGRKEALVRRDIKQMIEKGYFKEGHLDDSEKNLILTDDAYAHYIELKEKQEAAQAREEADRQIWDLENQREEALREQRRTMETIHEQQQDQKRKVSAEIQEMLDRGASFVRQIRMCNDAIPGAEISQKISRMEELVAKILERAEDHPEIAPKLKKMMDYYLPMTIKLLTAYADLDAQSVQGENITRAKQEIEATMDTLNDAFEKLLDSVFQETAMDVSSDISVLQTLLAQEGLTNDGFMTMTK